MTGVDWLAAEPWTLSDGGSLNITFDVPGGILWQRPEEARWARDLATGAEALITRGASPTPRPAKRIRLPIRLPNSSNRDTRIGVLEDAWYGRGPYTLTTPSYSLTVLTDPTLGGLDEGWESGARVLYFGVREVL